MRLVAIGLAAGFFSAFFGVGGGIIAVPLLILVAGVPERAATATSLLAIAITASAGVIVFSLRGEVEIGWSAFWPERRGSNASARAPSRMASQRC